jgi:2-polyprenyl-3-methyl-5-hydroxy-6-metoxy-1,4-benzoquinol methylase
MTFHPEVRTDEVRPNDHKRTACPVCGENSWSPTWQGYALDGSMGQYSRCGACGLVKRLTDDPHAYHHHINEEIYGEDLVNLRQSEIGGLSWERLWRRRFTFAFSGFKPRSTEPRVLEIGCGMGLLISAFRRFGCDVYGVELSEANARFARERLGLQVYTGTVEDAPLEPASFDLVILDNVLEHLPDPKATLKRATDLLRPQGGRLYIDTPNFEVAERLLYGSRWGIYEPDHVHLFSPKTMARLFEECGLSTVAITTYEPEESWMQLVEELAKRPFHKIIRRGIRSSGHKPSVSVTTQGEQNSHGQRMIAPPPMPSLRIRLEGAVQRAVGWAITPLRRYQERVGRGTHIWALAERP